MVPKAGLGIFARSVSLVGKNKLLYYGLQVSGKILENPQDRASGGPRKAGWKDQPPQILHKSKKKSADALHIRESTDFLGIFMEWDFRQPNLLTPYYLSTIEINQTSGKDNFSLVVGKVANAEFKLIYLASSLATFVKFNCISLN